MVFTKFRRSVDILDPNFECEYSAKQQEIQQIIDTLQISTLEYRNECDDDVKQYVQERTVDLFTVRISLNLLSVIYSLVL